MQKTLLVFWSWNGINNSLHVWLCRFILNFFINSFGMDYIMKNYALKWLTQRITAVILIPLAFWFIYSSISISKMSYLEITFFFDSYINSILFYVMMMTMLFHAKLGLQTIIDDYVTSKILSKGSKLAVDSLSYFLMIMITIFIIRNLIL